MKSKNPGRKSSLAKPSIIFFLLLPTIAIIVLAFVMRGDAAKLGGIISTLAPWVAIYLVLVIVVAIFAFRRTLRSLNGLANGIIEGLENLGEGNFEVQVDETGSSVFSHAAVSLNALSRSLSETISDIIRVLNRMADGDLTAEPTSELKGDWVEVGTALKTINERLGQTFHEINEAAEQTSSGSSQVASASQALAQGATEQASAIEQLSSTVTEVATHARNNAANATNADQASTYSATKIAEADQSMQQMVQAMGQISDTSNKISNIIKTIDNIAFQTNILALNAAVEAARAGSAGKGFAVVADEVRNLASKSAEAAKDTTALIEESIRAVNEGERIAEIAQKTLKEVQEAGDRANKLVNEIASASNQQAASIGQITQGVQQISSVVQTNSATAEQSAAASEELAAQAKALHAAVARIKLKERNTPKAKPDTARKNHTDEPDGREPVEQKPSAPAEPKAKAAFSPQSINDKYI